ncbi:MAG: hypothetical protein R2911_11365 [Caldilineaceae bacterium]
MRAPVPENAPLYEYTLMPTHIRWLFTPDELQTMRMAEPFSFTKGCPVMRLVGYNWADPVPFGTLLFDLQSDPEQKQPIHDAEIEARMIAHMIRLMQANDAPPEQYERLGLADKLQ